MKQIEFQHFRKAPHPFEQYGNLPPAAYKNRSIPQDYVSLPQGEQAFLNKGGKKQYQNRHQSSIKDHWLGQNQNDSLSSQVYRQNHKVFGKSLQTRDIQGAQGGSLKSPAVKYKQKAQKLKMHGKLNGFDQHDFQQEYYKLKIQNAVKSQHSNDVQIGKLISMKGHGHMLNPERDQTVRKNQNLSINKNSIHLEDHQNSLKEKYDDFESKNEKYKQFFKDIKSKQDNYGQFFSNMKKDDMPRSPQNQNKPKQQRLNTFQKYDQKDMPTPKITSRQHEYGLSEKFRTIDMQNERKRNSIQQKKEFDSWRQQEFIKNYQPPNYPKKSLQSQFKQEHKLGASLNASRIYQHDYDQSPSLNSSRKTQNNPSLEKTQKNVLIERELARKFNPTNLSHVVGSGSYSFRSDTMF